MEAYPPAYAQHNLPFVVLSGLGTAEEHHGPQPVQDAIPGRAGTVLSSDLPPANSEAAQQLLKEFLAADGTDLPWNGRILARRGNIFGYRIRTVGREFRLPPRKADPPSELNTTPPSSPSVAASWLLHSPLSPLSPDSSIFPDGLLSPAWIAKHQDYVPSAFIAFFAFTSDPNRKSIHDNQLKVEINKLKAQLLTSEYRTRLAVVLLSDGNVLQSADVEERLSNIRRATGLDPKNSLFFLPPNGSQVEIRTFALSVLTTLQPLCVEYYRDLTKHARRKKTRGSVPPPTAPPTRGTFHPLSQAGWNVRYDFKLGVFAEFRQEMDAAQRHYNIALDSLFGSDGIFETTASWSPRWDEMRLLADTIALRLIRCQLWNLYPTSAVQSWVQYRNRMRDLLDRRGKGSSNYGWEAWESRWAEIMGELIQKCELPVFSIRKSLGDSEPLDGVNLVFSPPEKHIPMGERLSPWEHIHHPGYWFKIASDHAKRRCAMAREIPEEDRVPPGQSPATKVSHRNQTYDHYLVPEPHMELPVPGIPGGFEHWKDIVSKLNKAVPEFQDRGQFRKVEQLQLDISRTLLQAKQYADAFAVLRPMWESMSWRREGWFGLASEVLWALHECALRVQDAETYVLTEWELYSPAFAAKPRYRHDLMNCLNEFSTTECSTNKPSISINTKNFTSCLTATFTFSRTEGNVGEPLRAQIAITSSARPGSAPITPSTLSFQFTGCLSDVQISHNVTDAANESSATFAELTLEESVTSPQKPRWTGAAGLTMHPGQTRVFEFPIIFREAGDTNASTGIFEINTDGFDLLCSHELTAEATEQQRHTWWLNTGAKLKPRHVTKEIGPSVKVLPKPPKMEVRLPDVRDQYYTDEPMTLAIEVQNQEDEETEAVLEVRLLGRAKDTLNFTWMEREASSPMKEMPNPLNEASGVDLPGHVVGRLAQGTKITEKIQFTAPSEPSDYVLEVKVLYHLLSDRDIPISKIIFCDLVFNSPFEANFDITQDYHPDAWPSYFEVHETQAQTQIPQTVAQDASQAHGLAQKWRLVAKIASFAPDQLTVTDVQVETVSVTGGAICAITPTQEAVDEVFRFQDIKDRAFAIDARKLAIEDRRPTGLDLRLAITWHRTTTASSVPPTKPASSPSPAITLPSPETTTGRITSHLPIPPISLPSSEPRVLATSTPSPAVPELIHMDYTIENPTMHFLTFELNMDASEEFGFSGPKTRALNVLPLSRQTVRYNLYPLVRGCWIWPHLEVKDRYFNQVLRVVACGGLRAAGKEERERGGVGVWVGKEGGEGKEGGKGKEGGEGKDREEGEGKA